MSRVNREDFLRVLELVEPGLSEKPLLEQSDCYVFSKGRVMTFNSEIACSHVLKAGLIGAVKAAPLLAILRKLGEKDLELEQTEKELVLIGKGGRRVGIRMEREVRLEVDTVEKPEEWKLLHEEFADAVGIVHKCASTDESQEVLNCVHLAPKWLEASDAYQVARYRLKTGVSQNTLVRHKAIKHITSLGVTEFAETPTWLHFRNGSGLVFSCRRFVENAYPDPSELLSISGEKIQLPKGLGEAADKADVFSSENDDNLILIQILPGSKRNLWIKSRGVSGWYKEPKSVNYSGPKLSFYIPPALLMEIVERHSEVEVTKEHLRINGGRWQFVTSLGAVEEDEK